MTENIEERQAMLAAIIDSSEDAIISKRLDGTITSWNKSAERMFGYNESEMIGKPIHMLIPSDRLQEEDLIIAQLRKGIRIEHFETVRVTKSGNKFPISLTISPIKDSKGIIIGASKIARDITRQKNDEQIIRQYAYRMELINSVGKSISTQLDISTILQKVIDATTQLSTAAFGAFFYNKVDSNGETYVLYTISGAPKEAFEKFGMPRKTAIFQQTFDGLGIVRSDDITKDPRYGKNTPHHGMPHGHLPVVSYLAVPIISQTGIVIGGLFFGHPEPGKFTQEHEDLVAAISSQAAIALDNAKLYQEIQALNERKDEFIAFASHELKTPLTTLSGYIQLAKITPELPDGFLDKIGRQTEQIGRIIADLLDITKIQAGKMNLQFSRTSLFSLINESVESVDYGTHIFEIIKPETDINITVDRQKMLQVMNNLLTNAVKYSDKKTRITFSAMRLGEEIRLDIQDQGIGIEEKELKNIFNQFYQVKKTQNRAGGIGLGLYISKEIVEGHLGKIWAESEQGKGSVFHVSFPIERAKFNAM